MPKWNFSQSLLRGISDSARELVALANTHQLPPCVPEGRISAQLHLPEVRVSAQYLIDMGFRPEVAQHLLRVFMVFVCRYKQVFALHFDRTINGGGNLPSEYYRDVFVAQYERAIQGWGSRFLSTAWVWPCQAGLSPAASRVEEISIRQDDPIKTGIPSRIEQSAPSIVTKRTDVNHYAKIHILSQLEEENKEEELSSIDCLIPRIEKSTPRCHDPFSRIAPSACFPTRYPPLLGESCHSTQTRFVTSFTPEVSVRNEKSPANTTDVSSLSHFLDRLAITPPEIGTKAQQSCRGPWPLKSKKAEPLSPLLSPVVAGMSKFSNERHSVETASAPSAKATTVPRRRRIAPLPKRRTEATSNLHPSTSNLTVVTFSPCNPMPYPSPAPSIQVIEVDEVYPSLQSESPEATLPQPLSSRFAREPLGPQAESVNPKYGKALSRPCKVPSQPQAILPTRQGPTLFISSSWKGSSCTPSCTPSLISDTSSCADSPSSDELETPPSTPPSSLHALSSCDTMARGVDSLPKSSKSTLGDSPSLENTAPPRERGIQLSSRKEKSPRSSR